MVKIHCVMIGGVSYKMLVQLLVSFWLASLRVWLRNINTKRHQMMWIWCYRCFTKYSTLKSVSDSVAFRCLPPVSGTLISMFMSCLEMAQSCSWLTLRCHRNPSRSGCRSCSFCVVWFFLAVVGDSQAWRGVQCRRHWKAAASLSEM